MIRKRGEVNMALYVDLPVYKATYDLLLLVYKRENSLPREHRYAIVMEIKRHLVDILSMVARANASREKVQYLSRARIDLEEVRIRFRILSDLHLLGTKFFGDICLREESISKQLTAWYNSAAKNEKKTIADIN